MLTLHSFLQSVVLFVKSLTVKVTKQMYRSSSVLLTGMMVVLVALSCLFFELIAANYGKASAFQNQQYEAQKVIAAHYQWLEQLSDSITTGSEFEGSTYP